MTTNKNKNYFDNHLVTLVSASILLLSLGMTHYAFADTLTQPTNGTKIIFHDDYSSNVGWTQIGNEITVDSSQFPNMVKFNNVIGGGGTTEERAYKQLPSTLPAYNWVLETTYMFTSSNIPVAYLVALTTDSSNPEVISSGTPAPNIRIIHGYYTDQLAIQAIGSISPAIQISPNIQYYLKLERTSTLLILSVYSDPTRFVQVSGSPVSMNFDPTALHNLNFIQHSGSLSAGPARSISAQVTNTTISVIPNGTVLSAPSSPTGLKSTTVSSSQINLNWSAPANNGGSPITGYKIERSTDGGITWSTLVSNTASTATTYSDTGLTANITYTYRVSAINSIGTSSPSNTASATTSSVNTGSIVLNNVQSTSGTTSSLNQVTLSSFNSGTGNNRLLVVGVSANNEGVTSVTFGGTPLTLQAASFHNNDAEFWYLKNPTGTGDVVVTMNGQTQAVVGAYAFSGVNQTSPILGNATKYNTTPGSPSISILTQNQNDWILDLPSIYGGSTLSSPTCTQQWDANVPGAITGASSSAMVQSPGTITCSWTASSADLWDDVAIEINAVR